MLTNKMLSVNIISEYRRANADALRNGMDWYSHANDLAVSMGPVDIAAGVIAALSPNTPWDRNIRLAREALSTGTATGTLGNSCAKANRIMAGEPVLSVLGGNKVRSFYTNIFDPTCDSTVTIDRHAYDIAVNVRNGKDHRPIGTPKQYDMYVQAYRAAAAELGLVPWQLQAVTWESWRMRLTSRRVAVS